MLSVQNEQGPRAQRLNAAINDAVIQRLNLLLKNQKRGGFDLHRFLQVKSALFNGVQVRGQLCRELLELGTGCSVRCCCHGRQNDWFYEVRH